MLFPWRTPPFELGLTCEEGALDPFRLRNRATVTGTGVRRTVVEHPFTRGPSMPLQDTDPVTYCGVREMKSSQRAFILPSRQMGAAEV